MKTLAAILKIGILSLIGGAGFGFVASYAYYFFIAVPEAEHMSHKEKMDFLHMAGQTLDIFVILGSLLGVVLGIGIGSGILIERRRAIRSDVQ